NPWVIAEYETEANANGAPFRTATRIHQQDKNGFTTKTEEYDWAPYTGPYIGGVPAGATLVRRTTNTATNPTPDSTSTDPNALNAQNGYNRSTAPRPLRLLESTETSAGGAALSRTAYTYNFAGNVVTERRWDSTLGPYSTQLGPSNSIGVSFEYG